jgi:alcohol dehydrogenase
MDGVQAQSARLPFADLSTYQLPVSATRWRAAARRHSAGVVRGRQQGIMPGDTVAVVGVGPIGLAAIIGAKMYSPSHIVAIDKADSRLQTAK